MRLFLSVGDDNFKQSKVKSVYQRSLVATAESHQHIFSRLPYLITYKPSLAISRAWLQAETPDLRDTIMGVSFRK